MSKIKIMLDAGHGLGTSGKRTPVFKDGKAIREAEQNYPVMFLVEKYLKLSGFEVECTNRDIKYDMPLRTRTTRANNWKADYFVSIHKNAITGNWQSASKGIDTFVYGTKGKSYGLANKVQSNLIADTGMKDRGVKSADFHVLRETKMPAILIELGFMDNPYEALQMQDKVWHERFAQAITKGICEYVKVKPVFDKPEKYVAKHKAESIAYLKRKGILNSDWIPRADEKADVWFACTLAERLLKRIEELEK